MIKRLSIICCLFATALLATQSVKTVNGLAIASVKTMDQLAIASVKNVAGLDNTGSVSTSYANTGGTGDRTAIITTAFNASSPYGSISPLVEGTPAGGLSQIWWYDQATSGLYMQFDFGSGKVIDEAKWYQGGAYSHGIWQFEGSNDASSWTAIGGTFDLGDTATDTITTLSGNTTSYRYYRLYGISGSTSSSPWLYEIEFKISP